jgi:uncharacterized protein
MKLFGGSAPVKSWITPKAQKGLASPIHGKGLFAVAPILKDEIIVVKTGHIIDKKTLDAKNKIIRGSEAQISDNLYIAPLTRSEYGDSMAYCNHSCDPNAGFGGNVLVIAMRDIVAGEEITIDYAMMVSDIDFTLQCNCKALSHRPVITGEDWQIPTLQRKYAGYFSWYIEQKIKRPNLQP